ncbi:MAG: TPR repeat protein [Cocleimonas sp.]|jgi:TPR repeat protein
MYRKSLEERISNIEQHLNEYSDYFKQAQKYINDDPSGSLNKSRVMVEKLVLDLFQREMGHAPKRVMLGEMLNNNHFTRLIDRRILARMMSVRDMGNLGSHGELVYSNDASRILEDVYDILDWYIERHLKSHSCNSSNNARLSENPAKSTAEPDKKDVLILIPDFIKTENSLIEEMIFSELDEQILENRLKHVEIKRLSGEAPNSASSAIRLGNKYHASIVIWGLLDKFGVRLNYQMIDYQDAVSEKGKVKAVMANNIESFNAYVMVEAAEEFTFLLFLIIGQIAIFQKNYNDANRYFDKALLLPIAKSIRSKSLNVPLIFYFKGIVHSWLNEHDKAISFARQALDLNPNLHRAENLIGISYYYLKETSKAIEHYKLAIELSPDYGTPYNNIGCEHNSAGEYALAVPFFKNALTFEYEIGSIVRALTNMRKALKALKRQEEIIPITEEIIRKHPEQSRLYLFLAESFEQLEKHSFSEKAIQAAIELDDDPAHLVSLGNCYANQRKAEDAFNCYKLAAERGSAWALFKIGICYEEGINGIPEDLDHALDYYQKAQAKKFWAAEGVIGNLYIKFPEEKRDYAKAYSLLKISAEKDYGFAQYRLGYLYENGLGVEQSVVQAASWYQKAIENGLPGSASNLAELCLSGKIKESAIEGYLESHYLASLDKVDISLAIVNERGYKVPKDADKAIFYYIKSASKGVKVTMLYLAKIYEAGTLTEKNERESKRWHKNHDAGCRKFTIPCIIQGKETRYPFDIFILEDPINPEHPIEQEYERLLVEHDAVIPNEVCESFIKLFKLAMENKVKYVDLCVYALEEAQKDKTKDV